MTVKVDPKTHFFVRSSTVHGVLQWSKLKKKKRILRSPLDHFYSNGDKKKRKTMLIPSEVPSRPTGAKLRTANRLEINVAPSFVLRVCRTFCSHFVRRWPNSHFFSHVSHVSVKITDRQRQKFHHSCDIPPESQAPRQLDPLETVTTP